ncbi:MAG: hypothetical protein HYX97_00230 [Chloroflexi bacterium]|nr:hypothetical protein [Chloroflexota bacterium]
MLESERIGTIKTMSAEQMWQEVARLLGIAKSPEPGLVAGELVLLLAQTQSYRKQGQAEEALSLLRLSLQGAFERKALDRSQRALWEEAKQHYQAAAEFADDETQRALQHNAAICCLNLALGWERAGRVEDALNAFTEVTMLDPLYAKAHYGRAKLLARQTLKPDAVQESAEALRRAIELDESYRRLAERDEDFAAAWETPEFREALR